MTSPTTLHGISNCDTVKRARAWLAARAAEVPFHDFKTSGVPAERLDRWLANVGWEKLLNRQGSTWRRLDEAARAAVTRPASPPPTITTSWCCAPMVCLLVAEPAQFFLCTVLCAPDDSGLSSAPP